EALPVFEAAGDDVASALGYYASFQVEWMGAHMDAALVAGQRSVEHARRASLPQREYKLLPQLAAAQFHGSTPLANLEAWLDEQEAAGRHHPGFRANRAYVHAYSGRRDEARRLIAAARAKLPSVAGVVCISAS